MIRTLIFKGEPNPTEFILKLRIQTESTFLSISSNQTEENILKYFLKCMTYKQQKF